jgi:predicted nucleotidyltransferase
MAQSNASSNGENRDAWLATGTLPATWTYDRPERGELGVLLGSGARAGAMAELFANPGKERHLSALARAAGCTVPTLRKALAPYVRIGVLNARHDGNRLSLRANRAHPAFAALLALVRATAGVEPVLRKLIATDARVHLAMLFGSFAKGWWDAGSDIDLLLVGALTLEDAVDLTRPAETELRREINPVVYSWKEFAARRVADDPFLHRVLSSQPVVLKGSLENP